MTRSRPVRTKRRASKAEVRARLETVEQLLRRCVLHGTIQHKCAVKWDVAPRTVRTYIKQVYKKWDEEAEIFDERRVNQRRAQIEGILERALTMVEPDLRVAMLALDRLCRIEGNYMPDQQDVRLQPGGGIVAGLSALGLRSPEEVRGRIAELEERLINGGPIGPRVIAATCHEDDDVSRGNGSSDGGNGAAR